MTQLGLASIPFFLHKEFFHHGRGAVEHVRAEKGRGLLAFLVGEILRSCLSLYFGSLQSHLAICLLRSGLGILIVPGLTPASNLIDEHQPSEKGLSLPGFRRPRV